MRPTTAPAAAAAAAALVASGSHLGCLGLGCLPGDQREPKGGKGGPPDPCRGVWQQRAHLGRLIQAGGWQCKWEGANVGLEETAAAALVDWDSAAPPVSFGRSMD